MNRTAGDRRYRLDATLTATLRDATAPVQLRAVLLPRDGSGQRLLTSSLDITPAPAELTVGIDPAGHAVVKARIAEAGDRLIVRAGAEVTVPRRAARHATAPTLPWERAVSAVRKVRATGRGEQGESINAVIGIVEAALPTAATEPDDGLLTLVGSCFAPGAPVTSVALDLARLISEAVADRDHPGRPGVAGTAAGQWPQASPAGGSRTWDAAHLMCAALRGAGLAARVVSGYVAEEVHAAAETPAADTPHAWVSLWVPGGGWVPFDPWRGTPVDDRYVTVGWGRDLTDVPPLRVVGARAEIRGEARLEPV